LWRPFWKWRPVEIVQCRESIQDIIIYPHIKFWKIQHCPISSKFVMWVDNNVLNWFQKLKNFYQLPFLKCPPQYRQCWYFAILWRPVEIQCRDTIWDIIIYPHIKLWWYRTMLNFAVLWWPFWKWRTVEIFQCRESIRDIIICKNSTLSDIIKIWYVGRKWCPELIPDIEKFLPVPIFKMSTTIPHKFNIVRFQRLGIVQCRESIRDIIIYPHMKLWWYRTMLIFCDIVATSRICSMSGHHLGHHIEQFLPVAIFKMATTNSTLPDFNAISHVGRLGCP
jgi:hypothetical protein